MTPNQQFINGVITGKLSVNEFNKLKNELKLDEEFLSRILELQKKRSMNDVVLDFLSDSIMKYIMTGESQLEWLIEELEYEPLNNFRANLVRRMRNIKPRPERLDVFLGHRAL